MQEQHRTVEETDSVSKQAHTREISWRVHPLAENWKRSGLLLLFLSCILVVIYFGFQSVVVLLLSAILLIGPLYKYFLPFQYSCGVESLVVTACCSKLERPWSAFRSYYVDKNGVLLSPFAKPTRLENFRGVYVRFGRNSPEEIVDYIRCKINSES
ncbi:hypothetical protein J4G08_19040 [Candidatus Poribacteria bacterium]|nr:hypothetical protein [Candidatus Poribacteria bacterium]